MRAITTFSMLGCLAFSATAFAQPYSVNWSKISGGGGVSTGAVFSVSGTIGQADANANNAITGGPFSVTGGFWSLYAVQAPGAPALTIKITSTNTVMVCWPSPSTGFNLQSRTDLAPAIWSTPAETVQDNGTTKFIIVNPAAGNSFYRLKSP